MDWPLYYREDDRCYVKHNGAWHYGVVLRADTAIDLEARDRPSKGPRDISFDDRSIVPCFHVWTPVDDQTRCYSAIHSMRSDRRGFQVGDRVRLWLDRWRNSKPEDQGHIGYTDCAGTIVSISLWHYAVQWDDGTCVTDPEGKTRPFAYKAHQLLPAEFIR